MWRASATSIFVKSISDLEELSDGLSSTEWMGHTKGTQLTSGSDQAQKGRLVDALAIRGDEGRDTLR